MGCEKIFVEALVERFAEVVGHQLPVQHFEDAGVNQHGPKQRLLDLDVELRLFNHGVKGDDCHAPYTPKPNRVVTEMEPISQNTSQNLQASCPK
jgi:hypothetical protein